MNTLVWLLLLLPVVLLFAWAAKRLLGVGRLSATRTFLAGAIGFALGWLVALVVDRQGGSAEAVAATGIVLSLVFTMVAIVLLEMLSRRSRPRRPGMSIPHPIRAVKRRVALAKRTSEVTRIAARHGLGPGLGLSDTADATADDASQLGIRLREALEEAGGMFVKFGQLLATRPELVTPEVAAELAKLHQDVVPEPQSVMEPALVAGLGTPVEAQFAEFDWEPLGSASIGQAYTARLVGGETVVVKVQRPGVAETVAQDLEIVTQMAQSAEKRTSWGRQYGIAAIADEFAANLRGELDYRIEVQNGREIGVAMADVPTVTVPAVHPELSTSTVLVMERLDGEPLSRVGSVEDLGWDGRGMADRLFRAEVESMVSGETFHADPHPGNVMVLPDGRLGLIDFGSAGRLDAFEQAAVSDILMALYLRDPTLLREAAIEVASVRSDADPIQLERAFARLMAQHLGPGSVPSEAMLTDFLSIVFRFGMTLPASVTAMFRALGTLAGTLDLLSPGYPLIDAAQEIASDRISTIFEADNVGELVKTEFIRLAPLLQRAPRHMDRIAGQLERGELTARVSLFSTPADVVVVTRLVNRAVLAFLGATLGIVSTLLLRSEGTLVLFDTVTLLDVLGYLGLVGGSILVMRVILEVLRDDP